MAQQYKKSSSLGEGVDVGALVDGPADDLDATLCLNSSWRTFKGTSGTPNEYLSSLEIGRAHV